MSITPKSPAINQQGWVQTWVTSQWKNRPIPGQFSAEINRHIAEPSRMPEKIGPKEGSQPILALRRDAEKARSEAIDFELGSGEIVGLAGLEGQGQEPFLRMLAGLAELPAVVPVVFDDTGAERPLRDLEDAEALGVAYVSGDRKREGIFPNLSIYENLMMPLMRLRRGAFGWLSQSRLQPDFDTEVGRLTIKMGSQTNKITSLSGGNQQKVLIGRALACLPRILVMNDPARGIDIGAKRELYAQLRQFAVEGGAVVYLSSEIEEFLGFADRVFVFHKGGPFREFEHDAITEHAMLSAMFGHRDTVALDFETGGAHT